MANSTAYRFSHISMSLLMDDMRFNKGKPAAGDKIPEINMVSTTGEQITWQTFSGKPVFLTVGSMTCPMTTASIPVLKRLYRAFGNDVEFLMVNVREAHPAENIHQPSTFEDKLKHAVELKHEHLIPWTVVSDSIEGDFHQQLDTKPNSAYIIDEEGFIVFRSLFSNDEDNLYDALEAAATGAPTPQIESQAMVKPLTKAMGYLPYVLKQAGEQAKTEMWRVAPPMMIWGQATSLFGSQTIENRGVSAALLIVSVLAILAAGLYWLFS
ncbi:hypothetical protein C9J01_01870 [Photobacterium rosenbergii]|uniref:Thioredoxin domain-containing protein n=1 Tax=Photobacterium rosenbergii TaxID=294936 RepID=A0A2T3NJV0_9GAMM|nr:deiodinase-like protein [Photobacterium rosenbergii]PSW15787.1 hypothetical protein C9J01_01870 [Photobacterium rosenbergii]